MRAAAVRICPTSPTQVTPDALIYQVFPTATELLSKLLSSRQPCGLVDEPCWVWFGLPSLALGRAQLGLPVGLRPARPLPPQKNGQFFLISPFKSHSILQFQYFLTKSRWSLCRVARFGHTANLKTKKRKKSLPCVLDRIGHTANPRALLTPWLTHALSLVSLSFTRSDPYRPAAAPVRQPGPAPPLRPGVVPPPPPCPGPAGALST